MTAIPPPPLERSAFTVMQSGSDAVDLALWQVLRDVLLWAKTPPENREHLFRIPTTHVRDRIQEAADAVPLLGDPLAVLYRLRILHDVLTREDVSAACQQITDWADRAGLQVVALHFAEASAYAHPENPQWAVRAGYITRAVGGEEMFIRSEAWHLRAYRLAARQKNREVALRALTSTGALLKDKGQYGRARRFYLNAARRAERGGRKRQAAVALHYSFALASETGHLRIAIRDANAALRNYPIHDERIPALAHDVAYLLVRNQAYASALRLVDRLAERVTSGVAIMGSLWGINARAAAGAGHRGSYEDAAESALSIARINDECAGAVFVNLAEAARAWGYWEVAESHAARALAIAQRRADTAIDRLAVELLTKIRRREPTPPLSEPSAESPLAALVRRLAARLRQWRRYKRGIGLPL